LGKNGVISNYSYDSVDKTWQSILNVNEGKAIFTQPDTPIKCAGAPQKVMYLAEENFRQRGVRSNIKVQYNTGMGVIFSAPHYASKLKEICRKREIEVNLKRTLVELRPESKEAVFRNEKGEKEVEKYGIIHVVPPMSSPDFLRKSPLADSSPFGWVEVDKGTLQHLRYPNVFSLGDCSNAPTSKTAAAISRQSLVVAQNLVSFMQSKPLNYTYTGYTACPILTGQNSAIIAEFNYYLQPTETFAPLKQSNEMYLWALLKKELFPSMYWNLILTGHYYTGFSAFGQTKI